ncbi:MAG: M20/M25/M40 family metallo-hydrolase [Bacteroidetes bacterium]|nr:M20/M25/M40 family metallo-hydrolase [Bacteroidota bacterium]
MVPPTFARRRNKSDEIFGIIILLVAVLLAFFSIHTASPPAVVLKNAPDSVFSAERAKDHIDEIAKSPHSIGTPRNDSVKTYIVNVCNKLGLQTNVQTATSIRSFRNIVIAGKVNNIIARIKGTNNSKAVLIMGHYDSQPNTPGAGDDAAAVGAMLETARGLKAGPTFKNDIIFLFTDGEEMGLLGAQAFADDTALLNQVGLVLNFDGRGNAGISNTFEINPQNGWVINEFAKAAPYPVANSFSYEVYKRLPNYTDYTAFKEKNITGLNSGIIEGFVNYHSMTDIPANLDLRSVQHYGSNMLALAKHFGNIDLMRTKGNDISFFNFIGKWLVRYPANWNFFIVIFTTVLFIIFLYIGFKKKRILATQFLASIFIFIGSLIAIMIVAFLAERLIKSWYPLYERYDAANSYNSSYYFLSITSIAICIFTLIYQAVARKIRAGSSLAAILFVMLLLTYLAHMAMPTSGYLLFFPILFLLVGSIVIYANGIGFDGSQTGSGIIYLIFSIPAIFLLAPVAYFSFVAFGLQQTFIPIMMLGLLLGMLIPILYPVLKNRPYSITNFCLLLSLFSFVVGHFTSGFNEKKPLHTNLWYRLDTDSAKALWVSDYATKDDWDKQFLPRSRDMKLVLSNDYNMNHITNETVGSPFPAPLMKIVKDSVADARRKVFMHLSSARNALSMTILISRNTQLQNVVINGKKAEFITTSNASDAKYFEIVYYGLAKEGFDMTIEIPSKIKSEIVLIDRSIGLSGLKGFTEYPKGIIPGPDRNSNTIQVLKRFAF